MIKNCGDKTEFYRIMEQIETRVDNSEKQGQENSGLTSIQGMSILLQILHSIVE